jgi:multidrug efflux pump subunit AcrB
MNLSAFAVRRWQLTVVVFVGLVALGASALVSIPKAEDPTFPFPSFGVVAVLPGANPTDLEKLVVDPVEARLGSLGDLKKIKTHIDDGLAVIEVEFLAGTDAARKRDEVQREVTSLRTSLPPELVRLEVLEFDTSKVNVLELALVSDTAPYRELEQLVRRLRDELEAVPGVAAVTVAGLPAQEVQVALDAERMAALGVTSGEVLEAVSADARSIPAGAVDAGARALSVKTSGDYGSLEEVGDTVVRRVEGRSVRVRDLASVGMRDAEATHLARFNEIGRAS